MPKIVIKVPAGISKQDLKNLVNQAIDSQIPTEQLEPRSRSAINIEYWDERRPKAEKKAPVKKKPPKK